MSGWMPSCAPGGCLVDLVLYWSDYHSLLSPHGFLVSPNLFLRVLKDSVKAEYSGSVPGYREGRSYFAMKKKTLHRIWKATQRTSSSIPWFIDEKRNHERWDVLPEIMLLVRHRAMTRTQAPSLEAQGSILELKNISGKTGEIQIIV